jgi:diguanylate cyclase (GGDEF)-like protein
LPGAEQRFSRARVAPRVSAVRGAQARRGEATRRGLRLVASRAKLESFARPLAADDHRALYWLRHLRLGVLLTEAATFLVLAYVWGADRPGARATLAIAVVVVACAPLLLLVPIDSWSRDLRGVSFFYAWSVLTTAIIATIAMLDGGADSPLLWLLVLTLTYAGLAYPPLGVIAMGGVMVLADLAIIWSGSAQVDETFVQVGALVLLTAMVASASRNQWDLIDVQRELNTQLRTLANTDSLTLCLNRHAFDRHLSEAAAQASGLHPLSLCMVDLDGFKRVNDMEGHAAGDQMLARIASNILSVVRQDDLVGRVGGDEFAVLLPSTSATRAFEVGERVRAAVSSAGMPHGVTASVGVATALSPADAHRLVITADRLMYGAKRAGGDLAQAN